MIPSRFALTSIAVFFLALSQFASGTLAAKAPYASDRPMPEAQVFAPGVISGGDYDSHPAFTPDGRTLYFMRSAPNFRFYAILVSHYENGRWSEPSVAPFSGQYDDADPFITADGERLFFVSKRPHGDGKPREDFDIYVMERTPKGWSEPRNLGSGVNSPEDELYPTLAADGSLYFGSERKGGYGEADLYRARRDGAGFAPPENLGSAINTAQDDYEPYIAPDQSFLIFMACARSDSIGQCDLYLSRNQNGAWSAPRNLGPKINSAGTEYSPKLSPDGRYFFWASARNRFTDRPLPQRLDYAGLMKLYRSAGNGLCDIFQIDVSEIGIDPPAPVPQR